MHKWRSPAGSHMHHTREVGIANGVVGGVFDEQQLRRISAIAQVGRFRHRFKNGVVRLV